MKANDPKGIGEANADLMIIKDVKSKLSPTQTEFANKIADIKNRYMFGDAETRKAAKPEYDKLMADVKAEAMAKKVGEGAGEGRGDSGPSHGVGSHAIQCCLSIVVCAHVSGATHSSGELVSSGERSVLMHVRVSVAWGRRMVQLRCTPPARRVTLRW
jgi:hypothetical protein